MAHHVCGAPLLYSSGASDIGTPLLATLLMAHLVCGASLLVLKTKNKKIVSSGAPGDSAPLVVDIVMAHLYKVHHYYVYDWVKP